MFVIEKVINKKLGKCASVKSVNLILLLIFFLSILVGGVVFGGKAIEAQISNIYSQNTDEIAGVSPLMSAVTENDVVGVRFFSKAGRSLVNQKNIGGATALHMACREKNFEIVRILVENGADVNISDNEGWTPLMRAAMAGDPQIVDFLLSKGATAENINSVGESAVIHAALSDCDLCIDAIFKRGNLIKRLRVEKLKEQLTNAFVIAKNHDNQLEQELLERYLDQAIKMAPLMQMQRQDAELANSTFIALDESSDQAQLQARDKMQQSNAPLNQQQPVVREGYGVIEDKSPNMADRAGAVRQSVARAAQYPAQSYYQSQPPGVRSESFAQPQQKVINQSQMGYVNAASNASSKPKFKFVSGAPKVSATTPSPIYQNPIQERQYRPVGVRKESFADMSKHLGIEQSSTAAASDAPKIQEKTSATMVKYKLKPGSPAQACNDVIVLTKKRKYSRYKKDDIKKTSENKVINFKLSKPQN